MNDSILYDLYEGEIYPSEKIAPTAPGYRSLLEKISNERKALQEKLNAEDGERLEALGEMYVDSSSMYGFENFSYGFKLGARLMLEMIGGDGEPGV